jgi:tetratricopeptide (TPR) repeat protein
LWRGTGAEIGEAQVKIAREAYDLAEAIGGSWVKLLAQMSLGTAYIAAGRVAKALEVASRSVRLIETSHGGQEALARSLHSVALTRVGDPHGGMAEAERAIRCCTKQGNRFLTPWGCTAFANAAAAAGTELDRALEVLEDAERVVAETGARGLLSELLYARARVHAARGERDDRRETLQRGVQIARETQAHGWEKRFEEALARSEDPLGQR